MNLTYLSTVFCTSATTLHTLICSRELSNPQACKAHTMEQGDCQPLLYITHPHTLWSAAAHADSATEAQSSSCL